MDVCIAAFLTRRRRLVSKYLPESSAEGKPPHGDRRAGEPFSRKKPALGGARRFGNRSATEVYFMHTASLFASARTRCILGGVINDLLES